MRSPHPAFPPVVMCKMLVQPPIHFVGLKSNDTSYCLGSSGMVVTIVLRMRGVSLLGNSVKGSLSTGKSRKKIQFLSIELFYSSRVGPNIYHLFIYLPPIRYTSLAQDPPLPYLQLVAFPYFWYLVLPLIPAHHPPFCTAKM